MTKIIKKTIYNEEEQYQEKYGATLFGPNENRQYAQNSLIQSEMSGNKSNSAYRIAENAREIAAATNQHFWTDNNGVHVSSEQDNPEGNNNTLWNSIGMLFRKGANNLLALVTGDYPSVVIYDGSGNEASNVSASFGSTATIGKTSNNHVVIDSSSISMKSNSSTTVAKFEAPIGVSDTLSDIFECDGAEQMTTGKIICSVNIPQNCSVTGIEAGFTDELLNIYTISESAVYNANNPNTWFIYQQTSGTVTVKANGTFTFTFQTDISLDVHVNAVASHNYIGSYPNNPENNLFTIGNGEDSDHTHNALEVDWIGNVSVPDGFIQGKQNILWSGGYYMTATHVAKLSEPISEQSNGIVLLWSGYVAGDDNPVKNAHWVSYFIPRNFVQPPYNGQGFGIPLVASNFSNVGMKYVYVYDNRIVGNNDNSATGTASGITYKNNHWVLRFVIGV